MQGYVNELYIVIIKTPRNKAFCTSSKDWLSITKLILLDLVILFVKAPWLVESLSTADNYFIRSLQVIDFR